MKKILIIITMVWGLLLFWHYQNQPLGTRIDVGGRVFTVELAVTPKEQEKGLGYRDSLPVNAGMLFVYQTARQYEFWMKGMRFPIDIIWIRDQTVVDISKNVPVSATRAPSTYSPRESVNKVLEINAGKADELGIQIGDTATILR